MACFSPNFLISCNANEITPHKNENFKLTKDGKQFYKFLTSKQVGNKRDYFKTEVINGYKLTPIPCGCCIGCRVDYSKQWAARCMLEAEQWKYNYFITLTYDDYNLPKGVFGNATLVPDDFTNFVKRLRQFYKEKFNHEGIRIFGCGEYGDMSMRPHYHIMLFNCPIPDLSPEFHYFENGKEYITKKVYNGNVYYFSDIIHNLWNKGNILIGQCEWQSCAYVARYVVKKIKGVGSEIYKSLGIVPEFVRMSRRPGIGFNYYQENKDEIYEYDNIIVPDLKGAKVIVPPRYYDKMLKIENELLYLEIKEEREKKSSDLLNTIDSMTNLHYAEYLQVEEERKNLQMYSCKRIL